MPKVQHVPRKPTYAHLHNVVRVSVLGASLFLILNSSPALAEEGDQAATSARAAGHTLGSAAREIGQGAKKVGKTIGKEAKTVGKAVGHVAAEGGKGFHRAVTGKSSGKSDD